MAGNENTVSLDEIAEAHARLIRLATAFWGAQALHTALELDIFARLEQEPRTAEDLASSMGADAGGIDALLVALTSLGLVQKNDRGYVDTAVSRMFLLPSSPYYQGALLRTYAGQWAAWQHLGETLKSAAPPSATPAASSSEGRAELASVLAPRAARRLDLRRVRRILDLSDTAGAFAIELARVEAGISGTIVASEGVEATVRARVAEKGLADRLEVRPGRPLAGENLGSGFDLIILADALRRLSAPASRELLQRCFAALEGEGQCVICEVLLADDRQGPLPSALHALEARIAAPGGQTCSTWDVTDAMQGVGFIRMQTISLAPSSHDLVVGYHP